ncbi:hypothetical protein BSZ32_01625 [Rubritalea profundi]|uniref:Uncharacterized protein n=1 Tax=Rubritalea profundi TaxID=1658618 RepID=A0A2S7TYI4_9BACT|nr:hypothetical protein BSZ32_01625 [Rubritalea profundi]
MPDRSPEICGERNNLAPRRTKRLEALFYESLADPCFTGLIVQSFRSFRIFRGRSTSSSTSIFRVGKGNTESGTLKKL